MKATELRIGNLVYKQWIENGEEDYKTEHEISGYDLEQLDVNGCFYQEGEAIPIPLTEDWLYRLKFGLTINNKDSGYKQFGTRFGKFDIMFCIECNEEPECFLEKTGIEIKYVHQLQNLYFALTGDELQITE